MDTTVQQDVASIIAASNCSGVGGNVQQVGSSSNKPKTRRGRPPKAQQKTASVVSSSHLHNVLEFKQTYSRLLRKQQEIMEQKRPKSLLDTSLMSINDLMNDLSDDEEDISSGTNQQPVAGSENFNNLMEEDELEDMMSTTATRTNNNNLLIIPPEKQSLRDLLQFKDLAIKKPEQIIEEAIRKELKRTRGMEDEIDMDVPNDVRKVIDFSRIPKFTTILEEMGESTEGTSQQCVYSITEEAKVENGYFLPKRNENFIAPTEEANYFGKYHKEKNEKVPLDEVVLQVAIYHPIRNTKVQEFMVLGSQKLTELRDCIDCISNTVFGDVNNYFTSSAYLFIENIFYNDRRIANNIDYSENIIEWMKTFEDGSTSKAHVFSSLKMEDVSFYDLSIRLNEPYIYCHHGNCMHYIVFTEMRIFNEKKDVNNLYAYPVRCFQAKPKRRKCGVCEIYQAKWVTFRDKFTSDDPSFFCDSCYRQFHYDHDGTLLYNDFNVFKYYCE
ncbi:predicted protein [Naegleria gruberi]|uniref:Predicted protein n=1 Tax=Naegleria gruberi TaxID=5762 RepID=D2UXV4_NAEGR|nr:uncharacterized protein NAEGRDRAFT_61253 [Naegleria gruberi]EFC50354.1 predicted protein [Naegleria gruberi]|eukprot:XP_002683098.1 predicted protein [Naegleria gruberi strain NEG-M]